MMLKKIATDNFEVEHFESFYRVENLQTGSTKKDFMHVDTDKLGELIELLEKAKYELGL